MNRSKNFGKDPGLQARMLLTLFLLGLVYAVLIGVLFAAGIGAVTIAVIAGVLFLVQYVSSDKIALLSMGAREITPADGPDAQRLIATVQRLAIQADIPMPRIAIAKTRRVRDGRTVALLGQGDSRRCSDELRSHGT